MRIPFEGILAAKAAHAACPLLISVWGNDFTLCATHNPLIARQTREAMQRADALHCDCFRDLRLATQTWGFQSEKPAAVLPGAGGIQTSLFHANGFDADLRKQLRISQSSPVIINPRGFRNYVRNDVFFEAIPEVLRTHTDAIFICTGMEGHPTAEKWISRLAIKDHVRLLPLFPRDRMADLFRLADITVSPSLHDGTPNSLLEAIACGCFPVAGDIESVREWITDEVNGLLCDPTSPQSLAQAILRAIDDVELRRRAREINGGLLAQRADYQKVMAQAEQFYQKIIQSSSAKSKSTLNSH
jgi:glycosyltransferase involved in cell wall biosynthesis